MASTGSGHDVTTVSAITSYLWNASVNDDVTGSTLPPFPEYYSVPYIVIGFLATSLIFVVGVAGNVMVVLVVSRTRSMRSPTNCYLMSLAIADILFLVSAPLPSIVEYFLIVEQFIFGRVGCSLMVFFQYLGLNVSSLSITAFTIERYIAICHPIKAQAMCTVHRAKRIILVVWIFGIVYCVPWLALTTTEAKYYQTGDSIQMCKFALKRDQYRTFYIADLVIFYVLPLTITLVLYTLIGCVLFSTSAITINRGNNHLAAPSSGNTKKQKKQTTPNSRVQVSNATFFWIPFFLFSLTTCAVH